MDFIPQPAIERIVTNSRSSSASDETSYVSGETSGVVGGNKLLSQPWNSRQILMFLPFRHLAPHRFHSLDHI